MMSLGKQTGSVTNHLMSRVRAPDDVKVGDGATILNWTDRHAATIEAVCRAGKYLTVWVREDKATRTDKNGFSESQTYTYERNPNGRVATFQQRDGRWKEVRMNEATGRWNLIDGGKSGSGLMVGTREEYWDPCF